METSIRIAGVTVLSPVTVVTNLILSAQCAIYFFRLRTGRGDRGGFWARFFFAMSAATAAGALKHGLPHEHPGVAYVAILWICGLGSAASVYCAQRATLGLDRTSLWAKLAALELVGYVAVTAFVGPAMSLVVLNTAVGLIPVLAVESLSARRGSLASAWVAAGLGVSLGSALVYVGGISAGPWYNHIDIAHTLMGVSFLLMARGGSAEASEALPLALGAGVGEPA